MVALAACWVHPLPSLNRHRPQQRISDGYGLALLASMACCLQLAQLLMMALLRSRPWFQGGLGSSSWVSICASWCTTCVAQPCDALHVVLPSHVWGLSTHCALHAFADACVLQHTTDLASLHLCIDVFADGSALLLLCLWQSCSLAPCSACTAKLQRLDSAASTDIAAAGMWFCRIQ